jgi:hypothetical protein
MVVAVGNPGFAWFNQQGLTMSLTRRTFFRTTGRDDDHLIGAEERFQLAMARQSMEK